MQTGRSFTLRKRRGGGGGQARRHRLVLGPVQALEPWGPTLGLPKFLLSQVRSRLRAWAKLGCRWSSGPGEGSREPQVQKPGLLDMHQPGAGAGQPPDGGSNERGVWGAESRSG